ncbi:alanine--glyoxylate aminotransferase family protein [Methanocalculus sp.]|uniref:pyridoxal-phosphate-dependent aminotransferase family protein n=1 Tax=Methanocalculus sp. TaxID=2004547 RepID=UPI00271A0F3B|nr:alanine--glyoxylate aminotransferase family protein [Methanocalculus sp.]MDO8841646.1 alanine--glyoxylate aminotransferase family protein [Methanocalculus sp.]
MQNELLLMMPGPVPMPERVRNAMARQAINHRGKEFGGVYADCVRVLKALFGTKNDLFVLSGSGTAGMEAAIANVGLDKKIVSLVNGKFGERLAEISGQYGDVNTLASEWGHPLMLDALAEALEGGAEVVTMVHNETSAGILNPAAEVGRLARKHDALFIMDGITSIGGEHVAADEWGADIAIVGSQKCLAAPAGLSAISVSERAWDRIAEKRPYYLDLKAYRKSASKSPMETPYTPAVPLFFALREACLMAEEEGINERIARHRRLADAVRAAADAWGLPLLPVSDALHSPSNTVTAIRYPDGINDPDLRGGVKKMGIEIAGGQDRLKGKIFRIGTMGVTGPSEVLATVAAVQGTLGKLGYIPAADGVSAALEVLV